MYTEERLKAETRREFIKAKARPSQRREMARKMRTLRGMIIRLACTALSISQTC